ncbi:MAG TPA: acVLRF1 family peptidyl-tRNA hydrolase, partial [Trebonia sp.]|nr:acVLRF1 family peptidyl-tRNA hydrolase [Trebonia sp.]
QCVMKNPAAGGGRWVEVPPERFVSWIARFTERHGGIAGTAESRPAGMVAGGVAGTVAGGVAGRAGTVTFTAADGAVAECHPPFPSPAPLLSPALLSSAGGERAVAGALAAHAAADRTVGVLLVRLGGYAVGVFSGAPPRLVSSKTGSRPVHGRSAAGGWSQQRFARRRDNQASEALSAAASAALDVWDGWARGRSRSDKEGQGRGGTSAGDPAPAGAPGAGLDAVVLGGDKRAIAELRQDARLAPYLDLAVARFLTVPDPKLAVLADSPRLFLAVRIWLTEP